MCVGIFYVFLKLIWYVLCIILYLIMCVDLFKNYVLEDVKFMLLVFFRLYVGDVLNVGVDFVILMLLIFLCMFLLGLIFGWYIVLFRGFI